MVHDIQFSKIFLQAVCFFIFFVSFYVYAMTLYFLYLAYGKYIFFLITFYRICHYCILQYLDMKKAMKLCWWYYWLKLANINMNHGRQFNERENNFFFLIYYFFGRRHNYVGINKREDRLNLFNILQCMYLLNYRHLNIFEMIKKI